MPESSETGTVAPGEICPIRDSSTRTSSRKPRVSSTRISGVPGAAMLPGSTIFSVTTPSKGAVMRANDSVVPAASLAARALSTPDTAACARAAAPAARASAARRRARGVVELLRRGRALGVQACNAFVRRARQREGGIGRLLLGGRGGDALIGRQRGRAGASRMGGKVASIEHDQHLTRTHAIARRHADLPDRRQNARHDRGGRPRLDHATRLERVGDVGHGHGRDRDGNGRLRVGGCRLRVDSNRPPGRGQDASERRATRQHAVNVFLRIMSVIAFPGSVRAPRFR